MKNKSIKGKLVRSYFLVISISILILDILLGLAIKNYYYDSSEKLLKNQMGTAIAFYNKYFTTASLEENIYDNIDGVWNQTDAQIQIYDTNGRLLMDSIGVDDSNKDYSDVKKALSGEEYVRWIGTVDYYDKKVMSVSSPIEVDHEIVGVLRYIISLDSVDREISIIITTFFIISILVFIIGIVLSILIARSIINPITELTKVANSMASGDMNIRSSINDNDEVGRLAITFNYMADELVKKDKLKDEFISSVSHELRTPLTAIKGWVITLEDDNTDKDTLNMGLKIIEKESDRLGNMVEELLDFSRLQNGTASLNIQKVNIYEFIEYMKIYLSQRAIKEKKKFNVISNNEVDFVFIDVDKIKQVIINLVDNAFKFTEINGEITLEVNVNRKKINIIVIDNGCGISESDLPRVKEKFYKGKNAKSQNGIGLSICDEIIKMHGGDFYIESKEGVGTKIVLEIPNEREIYNE